MMKKAKKYTAILLLAVFAVCVLIGCNSNENDGGNGNDNVPDNDNPAGLQDEQGAGDPAGEAEPEFSASGVEPKPDYPELPVQDLGGYNYRVISRSESANLHWYNLDIATEEEQTGDPINDAVYIRNSAIEEKYNITITNVPSDSTQSRVRTSVRAGSDDYDLAVGGFRDSLDALIQDGNLADLKTVPYVNLTKPWWDQKAVEQLSIGDRLFATSCDLTIRDKDAAIIMMFSKTLAQNLGLGNLYAMVNEGTWTYNAMFEMMRAASKDLNGDGTVNDEDQIGLLTQRGHSLMLFNGAGETTVKLDENKIPVIALNSQRAIDITDLLRQIQGDKNYTINAEEYSSKYSDVWDDFQIPMFAQDRALFYHAGMNRVTLLRSMETDFGILPPPKFEESQENYYVAVDAWCTSAVGIPETANMENAGLILEALSYESRYTLLPAYYEISLIGKFTRDEESKEMIDLILANRIYELGDVFSWGGVNAYFGDNISQGRDLSLPAFLERSEGRIQTAIDRTLEKMGAF